MCACSTSKRKLGCNAQLIVDEFGEKLLEELDYLQEARNIQVTSLVPSFGLYCPWRECLVEVLGTTLVVTPVNG